MNQYRCTNPDCYPEQCILIAYEQPTGCPIIDLKFQIEDRYSEAQWELVAEDVDEE